MEHGQVIRDKHPARVCTLGHYDDEYIGLNETHEKPNQPENPVMTEDLSMEEINHQSKSIFHLPATGRSRKPEQS